MSLFLALSTSAILSAGSAEASDFVATGKCLFANCPGQLAKCIADATCAQNLICLNNCNGREDEAECQIVSSKEKVSLLQIRCGDLYASPAVQEFTKCAVTEKGCVGQKQSVNVYPVPPDSALVKAFNINDMTGEWSITQGLNPLFDEFDCQVHQFSLEKPGTLHADIKWRIREDSGDFIERSTVQTFDQEEGKPGHLHNGNNDFLDYTDDWYVLDFKPNAYSVIYYRGNNDAWSGYGGCTVYTKSRSFPEQYRADIDKALDKVGLRLANFKTVDNSCEPHPKESTIQEVEGFVEDLFPDKADTAPPPLDKIRKGPAVES